MKVKNSYNNFLLQLIDNKQSENLFSNDLKLNLYLTLLSLSNSTYNESIYLDEISTIEDFLRKTNNLKVKIQLKRKEEEIEKLLNEIKEIYENNSEIISKYNKESLLVIDTINTKDPKKITELIDKLTKEKMQKVERKKYYDDSRIMIQKNIFTSSYYIENDILYINTKNDKLISLPIIEFYEIFDYLLNIDNYPQIFPSNTSNRFHTILIANIIEVIKSNNKITDEIIPVILTHLLFKENPNYLEVDMSKFNIDNIKITDLYRIAKNNQTNDNHKTAKWKKVLIPNEYLYQRIRELTEKGMYYFSDNKFILENVENNTSDFKISISIENMKLFLRENLII